MEADDFTFGLGYEPGMAWSTYLDRLSAATRGIDLPQGFVPSTFLVADVDVALKQSFQKIFG